MYSCFGLRSLVDLLTSVSSLGGLSASLSKSPMSLPALSLLPRQHHLDPWIQDLIYTLGGYSWFSILDQGKAFHQGFIAEGSRHMTLLSTPWGLYQWVRISFGLSNVPAAFQRSVEEMLDSLREECCIPYWDDVICYASSFEEHVGSVRRDLQALQRHGVR